MARIRKLDPQAASAFTQFDVDEWNEAATHYVVPYFRKPRVWDGIERQFLRAMVVKLAKLMARPAFLPLLGNVIALIQRAVDTGVVGSDHLVSREPVLRRAAIASTDTYESIQELLESASPYLKLQQAFGLMDATLEASCKPLLRLLCELALIERDGSVTDLGGVDFGALAERLPHAARSDLSFCLKDPVHHIPIAQWRNIAAHRSFKLVSSGEVEVTFGKRNPRSVTLRSEDVFATLEWGMWTHTTLQLGFDIVMLDEMATLPNARRPGAASPEPMRLDACLWDARLGFSQVGFKWLGHAIDADCLKVEFQSARARDRSEALIHASQALQNLGIGVCTDPVHADNIIWLEVVVHDWLGKEIGRARVRVADADAVSLGKISDEEYINRIEFTMSTEATTD